MDSKISCDAMPNVKIAIVSTPVASPMPTIATSRDASSRFGIVRMTFRKKRHTPVIIRLSVTTVVARNANGIANRIPSAVPSADILSVLTIGSTSLGK